MPILLLRIIEQSKSDNISQIIFQVCFKLRAEEPLNCPIVKNTIKNVRKKNYPTQESRRVVTMVTCIKQGRNSVTGAKEIKNETNTLKL